MAAGYENVGTLEFLVDREGNAYFIEINCRIQVEHPVTEMLTGIDLVATQIRIAAGEPLGFSQSDVEVRGHAIEFRINAEDAEHDFRPGAGVVERYLAPGGPGVRMDSHLYAGLRGPAVLRLAARQADRLGARSARRRSRARRAALDELVVDGLVTNIADPPGAARERVVPRGPDDDEPARPGRRRRVPGGRGARVSGGERPPRRHAGCRPASDRPRTTARYASDWTIPVTWSCP